MLILGSEYPTSVPAVGKVTIVVEDRVSANGYDPEILIVDELLLDIPVPPELGDMGVEGIDAAAFRATVAEEEALTAELAADVCEFNAAVAEEAAAVTEAPAFA